MSWTNYGDVLNGEASWQTQQDLLAEEALAQMLYGREIALQVIASGIVGLPENAYAVELRGHANPGHDPADGWANDSLTIQVLQKAMPQADTEEPHNPELAGAPRPEPETDDPVAGVAPPEPSEEDGA